MMSIRLQLFIGIIVLILFLYIVNMVRKKRIDLRYALGWLFLAVLILILDIFPQIVLWIAELVGIEIPSNMVFFVGFLLLVIMAYALTVSLSRLSLKVKRLTQELALLREEMERMKK